MQSLRALQREMPFRYLVPSRTSGLILFAHCSCLSNSQDERMAGPTARAATIARVPARSLNRHARSSRTGNQGGRDRDLHLLIARDRSA